jgi:hypothetical protein
MNTPASERAPEVGESVINIATGATSTEINDYEFMLNLKRLRQLRTFLIQEAIPISQTDSNPLSLGALNLLRYNERGGTPTAEEWALVERHTQVLFDLLTEPLRRRFISGEIPPWISILPIVFAAAALISLFCSVLVQESGMFGLKGIGEGTLPFYLIWLVSLGAIGAVSFIGMNALSVQTDVTFDISNKKLMLLRITLGALFGLVIALPFGFYEFLDFVRLIARGGPVPGRADSSFTTLSSQALLLLAPFILGFSRSLVIMILNRLVEAVQAFFGSGGERSQTPSSIITSKKGK